MRTILLFTSDEQLVHRIGTALRDGERVMRLLPRLAAFDFGVDSGDALVALDCRSMSRSQIEDSILLIRRANTCAYRCVAIADGAGRRHLEVIGHHETRDFDVILTGLEEAATVLRAILNDADGTIGAAIALEAVGWHTQPVATTVAEAVLASGCKVSSVGDVERALGIDRSALGDQLADEGSPMPKDVVAIARATYAVVLLRRTTLSLGKVAGRIGYSKSRWLQARLKREFGADADELKARTPEMPIEEFLDGLLANWKAGSRGGGGGPA